MVKPEVTKQFCLNADCHMCNRGTPDVLKMIIAYGNTGHRHQHRTQLQQNPVAAQATQAGQYGPSSSIVLGH